MVMSQQGHPAWVWLCAPCINRIGGESREPLKSPNLGCSHGGLGDGCAELGFGWHQSVLNWTQTHIQAGLGSRNLHPGFWVVFGDVEGRICPKRRITSSECSSPPDPRVCWQNPPDFWRRDCYPPSPTTAHQGFLQGIFRWCHCLSCRVSIPIWVFALHNKGLGPKGWPPACSSGICSLKVVGTRAGCWHQGSHAKQWCWREPCVQREECQTYPLSPGPSPQPGSGSYLDVERFIRHSLN